MTETLSNDPLPADGVGNGPGWTLTYCIRECRDQARDQAFQDSGFANFMRATADHLERYRALLTVPPPSNTGQDT